MTGSTGLPSGQDPRGQGSGPAPAGAPGPAEGPLAEGTLAAVLDILPDAILVSDGAGRIRLANRRAEELFGYGPGELQGRAIEELVPERYRGHHARHRARYRERPAVRLMGERQELWGLRRDGSEFPAEISLSPLGREGAGGPQGGGEGVALVVSAVRDVSERRRIQEALERRSRELARSNAELEQFAYVASHDLQEPLRMVTSYAQLLERRYGDRLDEEGREFLRYLVDGARRMRELINDLLDYSRVERRGRPFARVSLERVLDEVLLALEPAIRESGAEVRREPLPELWADEAQMRQLFQNLLSNAIKFRGEAPPQVELSARPEADGFRITVADNGIGIAPEYAERIFLLFQRLHTQREYPGTGIGLAICKKIVERHGGRIWVDTERPRGAAFHVLLPERPPEAEEGRASG
ncbi:MAG: PAS domain S-box protein, partial [Gammaproteobacteria bacterium]